MSRPGTEIALIEEPPARTPPTDTGVFFVVGPAEKGAVDAPHYVRSMSEFERIFGARVTYSYLWDAMDCYFKEGGSRAYVARVVGPAPANGSTNLKDGTNVDTLKVEANSPGAWGNGLTIDIEAGGAGGTFVIVVNDSTGELERSLDLADKAAAIAWAQSSDYIILTDLGGSTADPAVVAGASLTTGTDDNTNITEDNWTTALALFDRQLGPGQVAMPGRTTLAAQTSLLAHAESHNRVALIDLANSGSKATLKAAVAALRGAVPGNRLGAAFGPWVKVPGIIAGTLRTVPYSPIQAGIIARNDVHLSPNVAAAGEGGQSIYVVDLAQPAWVDADRQELNEAGVNIVRKLFNGIMTYGYRTLVDPNGDPNWVMFSNSRLYMAIVAQADAIAEKYTFHEIDGKGYAFKEFGGELAAMLANYYNEGSLYGATSDEAYLVDTGSTVNTPTMIADLQIRAVLRLRMSPFGELVHIDIVKKLVTEAV